MIFNFADALWQWRRVKSQTENVDMAIEREFMMDETAIATKEINTTLNKLEKFVSKPQDPVIKVVEKNASPVASPFSRKSSTGSKKWKKTAKVIGKLGVLGQG